MAIDYEQKAREIRSAEDVVEIDGGGSVHDPLAKFLRQFAAEVIGETEHEFYEMTKGEIMLRRREVITFLINKKAEIEAGR